MIHFRTKQKIQTLFFHIAVHINVFILHLWTEAAYGSDYHLVGNLQKLLACKVELVCSQTNIVITVVLQSYCSKRNIWMSVIGKIKIL